MRRSASLLNQAPTRVNSSNELMGKDDSIIFEGTTRDREALVLLLRFVDEWELKVRLVRFQLGKSSVWGDELARIMIEVLHRKLGVLQGQLLAAIRDRASVNTCALRTVSVLYPDMLDVSCISHFLDRVGVKCKTPAFIYVYMEYYFHHKHEGQTSVWSQISGRGMPRYNSTRWWPLWECLKVVFVEWNHVPGPRIRLLAKLRGLCRSIEEETLGFNPAKLLTNTG